MLSIAIDLCGEMIKYRSLYFRSGTSGLLKNRLLFRRGPGFHIIKQASLSHWVAEYNLKVSSVNYQKPRSPSKQHPKNNFPHIGPFSTNNQSMY